MENNQIDVSKIKFWYGYYNDYGSRIPIITIASYLMEDGTVSRGVSVCSDNETPSKKIGRAIQINRLKQAIKNKTNSLPINWKQESKFPRNTYECQYDVPKFIFKSIYGDSKIYDIEKKFFHI